MSRLSAGGLIDRQRPLSFTFDGKAYSGFEGDTLASALVANDVRLVGRSFKYTGRAGSSQREARSPTPSSPCVPAPTPSRIRARPPSRCSTVWRRAVRTAGPVCAMICWP
jgi:hypothetical protein